jgi:hypothetical protein
MPDAQVALGIPVSDIGFEVGDFAGFFVGGDLLFIVHDGNSGAVVAPVFQSFESFDEQWGRLAVPHIGYNSTHKRRVWLPRGSFLGNSKIGYGMRV